MPALPAMRAPALPYSREVPTTAGERAAVSSPPGMEVVRRAVVGADLDPIRGGERFRHVGLGGGHRLRGTKPLGEAGGDRRGERAAGALGIVRRGAVGGEAEDW